MQHTFLKFFAWNKFTTLHRMSRALFPIPHQLVVQGYAVEFALEVFQIRIELEAQHCGLLQTHKHGMTAIFLESRPTQFDRLPYIQMVSEEVFI